MSDVWKMGAAGGHSRGASTQPGQDRGTRARRRHEARQEVEPGYERWDEVQTLAQDFYASLDGPVGHIEEGFAQVHARHHRSHKLLCDLLRLAAYSH